MQHRFSRPRSTRGYQQGFSQLQTVLVVALVGSAGLHGFRQFGPELRDVVVGQQTSAPPTTPALSSTSAAAGWSSAANAARSVARVASEVDALVEAPDASLVGRRFFKNVSTQYAKPDAGFSLSKGDAALAEALVALQDSGGTQGRARAIDILTTRMGGENFRDGATQLVALVEEARYRMSQAGTDFSKQDFNAGVSSNPWVDALRTVHYGPANYPRKALHYRVADLYAAQIPMDFIDRLIATYEQFNGGITPQARNQFFGAPGADVYANIPLRARTGRMLERVPADQADQFVREALQQISADGDVNFTALGLYSRLESFIKPKGNEYGVEQLAYLASSGLADARRAVGKESFSQIATRNLSLRVGAAQGGNRGVSAAPLSPEEALVFLPVLKIMGYADKDVARLTRIARQGNFDSATLARLEAVNKLQADAGNGIDLATRSSQFGGAPG